MVLSILTATVCLSTNVVHGQTVVLNVYGRVTNGNWVRDWLTDLPDYDSTVSYSVSNSGNLDATNVSISISIDGNPYLAYTVPLIMMYSAYSSSFLYSTQYNQTKNVLIMASCQGSSNASSLSIGSTFPSSPYVPTIPYLSSSFSTIAKLFITPYEQNVVSMKNSILSNKPYLDPDWTALWSWVGSHITYSQGSYYHWKFPWETLQSGEGMCADYSILLVSLYRDGVFGPDDAYVVCGINQNGDGHAWVTVRLPLVGWYTLEPQATGNWLVNLALNPFAVSGYTGLFEFNDQQFNTIGTTVYINSDGSVVPSSAPIVSVDNVTYTFTGNMNFPTYNGIVVERSNIVIDGKGYTVQGINNTNGLNLTGINNTTIRNIHIENFQNGIYLFDSNNNIISGNTATANNGNGISLDYSSNNSISGNTATANNRVGIYLGSSNNNIISGNNATANSLYGIKLYSTLDNIVSGNNVTANSLSGIYLESCSNNTIVGNTVKANYGDGIGLWLSSNNTVKGNNAGVNVRAGIYLGDSSHNIVSGNTVTANSLYGIDLYYSSYNTVYHNNLVGNAVQASADSVSISDTWDNGYPSGGNYWSDYTGTDANHDGIGDAPRITDTNNIDHYPLMGPYSTITIPGDIDHNLSVNLLDLYLVAQAYGSKPGDSRWNPNADIDGNGVVGLYDLYILTQHYGQHYP